MTPESTGDVSRVFDDWAERGRGEGMEHGHRQTAGHVLDEMGLGPDDLFLDLGTGIGWAARDAAGQGARAVGVDVAPQMLARARRTPGPQVDHLLASFEQLPFPAGTFDVAFSMEALYYAEDLEAALAETTRVLAPGGRLHALIDFYEENEASHGWPEMTGVAMHLLSEAGWVAALRAAGFDKVEHGRLRAEPGTGAEAWKVEHGTLHLVARMPALNDPS